MGPRLVSVVEIKKHSTQEDCWIVVDDDIWDMTEFTPEHPGGAGVIYKHAGRDATASYSAVHAPSILPDNLDPSKYIGKVDKSTIDEEWSRPAPGTTPELQLNEKLPLRAIINAFDFEEVAKKTISAKNWAFYSSAATDCITRDANRTFFDRVWFRPRVLVNVKTIDTRSKILGNNVDMPLFISPSAMARLMHPDGEKAMARGCASKNIVQFLSFTASAEQCRAVANFSFQISSNASYPVAEIVNETPEGHPSVFQLYVNKDRKKTYALIEHVLSLRPRIRAIIITVDCPVTGKREADERLKSDESLMSATSGQGAKNDEKGGGLARSMGGYIDDSLCWEDLKWIRERVGPDMPLLLKGIQGAADARMAMEAGMQGIMVSNHGGRDLDTSPPVLLILLELHRCCPEVFERMEVYVDGGIRRGTDILKCICLGARAVGIGRHFLYALGYGQEGVEHLVELLRDELETTMKLVGIDKLSQAHPGLVNTADLDYLVPSSPDGLHPYARWPPKARM